MKWQSATHAWYPHRDNNERGRSQFIHLLLIRYLVIRLLTPRTGSKKTLLIGRDRCPGSTDLYSTCLLGGFGERYVRS